MPSTLIIHQRYYYDPTDRLIAVGISAQESTQRFYQSSHLVTELEAYSMRSILRHEAQPLAQQRRTGDATETSILATDQAHSLLRFCANGNSMALAYSAYGHHQAESSLSRWLGFNGNCPDAVTGHYPLGNGMRNFNPVLMRFNCPDDLSPFGDGGLNAYAYCGGDPVNFNDPTGTTRHHFIMQRALKTSSALQSASSSSRAISKTPTSFKKKISKGSNKLSKPLMNSNNHNPKSEVSILQPEGFSPPTHELMARINAELPNEPNLTRLESFGKRYDSSQNSIDPMKFSPKPEQLNNLNHHYARRPASKIDTPNGRIKDLNEALQMLLAKKTSVKKHLPDINRVIRQLD